MTGTTLALLVSLLVPVAQEDQYLSGRRFKNRMSHIVEELAGSIGGAPSK